jgi:hypothetical protein
MAQHAIRRSGIALLSGLAVHAAFVIYFLSLMALATGGLGYIGGMGIIFVLRMAAGTGQ